MLANVMGAVKNEPPDKNRPPLRRDDSDNSQVKKAEEDKLRSNLLLMLMRRIKYKRKHRIHLRETLEKYLHNYINLSR